MNRTERIMTALQLLAGGKAQVSATYNQIRQHSGCARATIAGALDELQQAGRVRVISRSGRGGITTYELVQSAHHPLSPDPRSEGLGTRTEDRGGVAQDQTELVQSETELLPHKVELVQSEAEVVQSETELVQSGVATRSQQMQTSLAEMQTSSTFDGNKAATIELVQSDPRARARHDHENDFHDDDEAIAFQKLLALLGEAGLEGRNKTWLAKQLMPKIAELPRIKAICVEVDKQGCWKKPVAVKFMKLKAFALGYQDPLPLFADEDQRKNAPDPVRTPARNQSNNQRKPRNTFRREQCPPRNGGQSEIDACRRNAKRAKDSGDHAAAERWESAAQKLETQL